MRTKRLLTNLSTFCLSLAMVVLFTLPCNSAEITPKDAAAKGWPKIIAIGSGTGTFYYVLVAGIATMTDKYLGVRVAPSRTTGTANVLELMLTNEIQGGIIDYDGLYSVTGQHRYQGKAAYPARAWLQSVYIDMDILTRDPKIKTVKDLKGKTAMLYPRGSPFHEKMAYTTLRAYGLEPSDLTVLPYDSSSECNAALKTGKIDAFYGGATYPSSVWVDLMLSDRNVRILHIDDEHMAKITAENPALVGLTIPGGTYPNHDKDIQVVATLCYHVSHVDLPDSFVYEQTKMVWERFDEFCAYHPRIRGMYKPQDVKIVNMLYHPGAIKYYKEIGVWGPEEDKRQAELLRRAGVKR